MSTNLSNSTSIVSAVGLFIGSLSGLEATGLVVGIIVTLAVGITAIRKNVAETRLAHVKLRSLEYRKGADS